MVAAAPRRVAAGVGAIITSCALLTALSLIQVLDSTSVFKAVKAHTASTQPFAAQYGVPPALSRLPSALLIGERSAFVQVSASWGERTQSLDYYLLRSDGQWQVQAVQPAREHLLAKYMLQAPEKDIPQAPQ